MTIFIQSECIISALETYTKIVDSWQSGRFQIQRSMVLIQSLADIHIERLLSNVLKRRN